MRFQMAFLRGSFRNLNSAKLATLQAGEPANISLAEAFANPRYQRVLTSVERFDRRRTEPFKLFRSEFGQNSWNRKKTTKNHFTEVAFDPKYEKG